MTAGTTEDESDNPLRRINAWRRRHWKLLRFPVYGVAAFFTLGLLAFAYLWVTVDLPDAPPVLSSSVVVDAEGNELAILSEEGQRYEVPLDEVSPVVVDALIAAEDRRFYSHGGVDPVGIARAAWHDVRNDQLQGGSTLTQQLVKNSFLTSERTLTRKVKEAVLAIKLDRTMDKDEILERYLNTVYFGRGAYGIEAAARLYFDTSAVELDLEQAALLVGLLRAPELADPDRDPDVAHQRRATVLDAMVAAGAISPTDADRARESDLGAEPRQDQTPEAEIAPHFIDWVRQQAVAELGEARVFGGGLRIITTLSLDDQRAAEEAIESTLNEPGDPQATLVALDEDGAVRAYVGGRDYAELKVDLARGTDGGGSGRQPGSSFKPFVLAAALDDGVVLDDRFPAPSSITVDVDGTPWDVENYEQHGYGSQTVAEATAASTNTVYAQLLAKVGPRAVAETAQAAGITTDLEANASIALGAEEVSALDLTAAYLTLAREGSRVMPYAIERIEVDGETIWTPDRPSASQVIDEDVARTVTSALEGVVDHGTGTAARLDRPSAGKTGTTQENVDAWFAGYTPSYAATVWMGYPEGATPMDDVHGRAVTGGSFPAAIWQSFMTAALEGVEPLEFTAPSGDHIRRSGGQTTTPIDGSSSSSTSTTDDDEDDADDDGDIATDEPTDDETTTTTVDPDASTTSSSTPTTVPATTTTVAVTTTVSAPPPDG